MDNVFRLVTVLLTILVTADCGCTLSTTASSEVSKSGNTYTCRDDKAWTNAVRRLLTDSMIEELDALDRDTGKQSGQITTECVDTDDDEPDIFDEDEVTKWCASGCGPLPQDYDTYWDPDYDSQSATTELDEAPIQPVKNYTVTVNCRDGFAPENGNGQTNIAYCTENGWNPALSNIQTCTSGCKDVRNDIEYGYSNNLRSTSLGGTPFNIGDVLTFACDSGYTLSGSEYLTCGSTQTWTPDSPPTCEIQTTEAVSSAEESALHCTLVTLALLLKY